MANRTRLILFGALSVALTILILLASWQNGARIPQFTFQDSFAVADTVTRDQSWRLHPEDHAFREPRTIQLSWNVTSGWERPDGVLKRVYKINGAFPSPTVELRTDDRVIIDVYNGLANETLSLHWHGLSMKGYNHMDGAAGITQDPIAPGDTFTYSFSTQGQHGTFWYHAHDGVQRADGLYGGLIIHEARKDKGQAVTNEYLLMIGDWYHQPAQTALERYMHPGAFGIETVPDSLLVNGRGRYVCSNAVPARPIDCHQDITFQTLELDMHQDAVLRIVNVGAYAGFNVEMNDFLLRPLYIDGGNRVSGSDIRITDYIHPGQRIAYKIVRREGLITPGTKITITLDETPFKYQNPALTVSQQFPLVVHGLPKGIDSAGGLVPGIEDDRSLKSASSQTDYMPATANTTIVVYTMTQKLAHLENEPHGFVNHTTWKPQKEHLSSMSRHDWDKSQFVPAIETTKDHPVWVDLVVNNLDEEGHPFHLHGYDFWVLSTYSSRRNWGSYNPFETDTPPGGPYELANAVKRDTVYIPRRGYAVLRFEANNPGIWMFHCHVLWHLASGMAMAFDVVEVG